MDSTTEMIKISKDSAGRPAVSGRELHAFLEIQTAYKDWFPRMVEYGFLEKQDFEVLLKNEQNPQGGRPAIDHAISMDMAKEISMVQRSEKGKEARQYFIACEKKLMDASNNDTLSGDYLIRLGQSMNRLNQQLILARTKIAEDAPKVAFHDTVKSSNVLCHFQGLANVLFNNGVDIGRNRLFRDFRDAGDIKKEDALFTQKALDRGIGQNVQTGTFEYRGVTQLSFRAFLNYRGITEVFDRYDISPDKRDAILQELTAADEPLAPEVCLSIVEAV